VILHAAEIEYEDELEYEDDWGTIASKEKRAGDDRISSFSAIGRSFSRPIFRV
jgi:hypothetical protein